MSATIWDLPENLRSKTRADVDSGCWLWTGVRQPQGYGRVKINHRALMAYRVSYEALVAEIPAGMTLDHLCQVPACINPRHVEPVTLAENARRAIEAARKSPVFRCGHPRTSGNTQEVNQPRRPTHRPMQTCLTCDRASQLRHRLKRNAERRAARAATNARKQAAA